MTDYIPLRVRAKLLLKRLLPAEAFEIVRAMWIKVFSRFVGDKEIIARYQEQFLSKFPAVVQAGPFAGMQYVDAAIGSSYLHKLVGSYEAVLHPYIETLRTRSFDTIIDVGSAEGYYLVGFGMMFPKARLIGFELEEEGRRLNQELFDKNALGNDLALYVEATGENVAEAITRKTLLICDCEGGEVDILDPKGFAALTTIDTAIVELHDFIRPHAKEILTERFTETHEISFIRFQLANPEDFPFLRTVSDQKDLYELRRERAWQEQEWMILEKK